MAVITRFIVVRNGVELDKEFDLKKEADAYDKMIDAAADLADLIETSKIEMDEYAREELTIFLARNAQEVKMTLKNLPYRWP